MSLGTTRRTIAAGYRRVLRPADARAGLVVLAVAVGAVTEFWTPLPGLRLLLAVAVIAGPAVLFDRFWRALLVLRDGNVDEVLARPERRDWRGRRLLWVAFVAVWALDLVATVWFFFVPTVRELHPVTVFLYGVAGVPGVLVAGTSYALVVAALVRALSRPHDVGFLVAATLWYGILVVHNYVLLLGGRT